MEAGLFVLSLLAAPAAVPALSVTFEVLAPPSTPPADTLYLAGDHPALGGWDAAGVPLASAGNSRHRATVRLAPGTAIEFKVTRGSWETVEKDRAGREIANRRQLISTGDTIRIEVEAWRDQVPEAPRRHTLTGDIRSLSTFPSKHLRHPRDVLVYLPPGYDDHPDERYPVFYLHDGNNVFDEATAFIGVEWGLDETAERLIRSGAIPPVILVAVANSPDRVDEYTAVPDPSRGTGGHASDYARFLVEELKPAVDAAFRTRQGPASTGTVGSSLGGLVSLYLGYSHPETFGRIGVVSPACWWGELHVVQMVRSRPKPPLRVWLDIGTAEGRDDRDGDGVSDAVGDARLLRDALIEAGFSEGADLAYMEDPGAPHNEAAWARRAEAILMFLCGDLR